VANRTLMGWVCSKLIIQTIIRNSWDYQLIDGKSERLIDVCVKAGDCEYTPGPATRDYINETVFAEGEDLV
jgi:hypothetical protein